MIIRSEDLFGTKLHCHATEKKSMSDNKTKDNLKYTLQHKIQIDANGQILSVLDVKRKYLVKANKKYRLLLSIPLLFTFIFGVRTT
jgi:hypothetical protein